MKEKIHNRSTGFRKNSDPHQKRYPMPMNIDRMQCNVMDFVILATF